MAALDRAGAVRVLRALDDPRRRALLLAQHLDRWPELGEVSFDRGWEQAGRPGAVGYRGLMIHHTASAGSALAVVRKGRPDVPGPLAQAHGSRQGRLTVICAGAANHPGKTNREVIEAALRGRAQRGDAAKLGIRDTPGWAARPHLLGVELDQRGTHTRGVIDEPWGAQLYAGLYMAAVCLVETDWPTSAIIGHREATARKVDPAYGGGLPSMLWFRQTAGMWAERLHGMRSGVVAVPAPVVSAQQPAHVVQFVARHWPHAQRAAGALGVSPFVVLAQAAVESGWGRSDIAVSARNYFGMVRHWPRWRHLAAYRPKTGGPRDSVTWCAFSSDAECYAHYVERVRGDKRYADYISAHTIAAQAEALGRSGWSQSRYQRQGDGAASPGSHLVDIIDGRLRHLVSGAGA